MVRDERADFGKATLKDDQFVTRWIHKLNEKPHTYYKNEFAKTGSSVFSPRMANTRPFGTYVQGFHGLTNDPNSTIGGHMAMLDKNQRSSRYDTGFGTDNQPVYKIGDKEHRRALSMNSSNHHYLYTNEDTMKELERILEPNHRALDMNNSYFMRGEKFKVNPYNKC